MQKLYLDCDGVILDTINTSYKMMEEQNIETDEDRKIFYSNLYIILFSTNKKT